MSYPGDKQLGYTGDAVCPREGCPSTAHDVYFKRNLKHEVVSTTFECRVCGAMETWINGAPEGIK